MVTVVPVSQDEARHGECSRCRGGLRTFLWAAPGGEGVTLEHIGIASEE